MHLKHFDAELEKLSMDSRRSPQQVGDASGLGFRQGQLAELAVGHPLLPSELALNLLRFCWIPR